MEKGIDYKPVSSTNKEFKAFVIGLSQKTSKQIIFEFFSKRFPSLKKVEMLKKNKKTGKIKGYGFLILSSKEEFERLISLKTFQVLDRVLFVKPYYKGEELRKFKESVEKKRIYIQEIPLELDDDQLLEALEVFGKVEDAFIARDVKNNNESKGFGYATFDKVEFARKAVLQGEIVMNAKKMIISEFQSREKRRQQRQQALDQANVTAPADDRQEGSYQAKYRKDEKNESDYKNNKKSGKTDERNFIEQKKNNIVGTRLQNKIIDNEVKLGPQQPDTINPQQKAPRRTPSNPEERLRKEDDPEKVKKRGKKKNKKKPKFPRNDQRIGNYYETRQEQLEDRYSLQQQQHYPRFHDQRNPHPENPGRGGYHQAADLSQNLHSELQPQLLDPISSYNDLPVNRQFLRPNDDLRNPITYNYGLRYWRQDRDQRFKKRGQERKKKIFRNKNVVIESMEFNHSEDNLRLNKKEEMTRDLD